ncbi:type IV pili methyl-accepting chemotaxis transducer N-terminal domain-containing protein [Undibacterium sp.]|jgi:hypothetical protein|uniref:type IV pili methyl-accepting chemotaxis transducer N-terminal domain-containing protein n=1 Tax=Undibacterium sp. TaxID=1914977 RepID=UPI002BC3A338|nr:type IV pili methyl-accepting chemotaxis transducer N-terminal domain-containing protein [Undibacterium sp.]HTD02280.1 type IV pili methyl-accepting chemotaxis transducer N-terminal domain-containing protein [Undibacterium sp.]
MLKEKSMSEPHANPSRAPRVVSSDAFGALINLAGRQRMLSQRIILHAVLASLDHEGAWKTATGALSLFRETHLILIHGKDGLPGVFFEDLRLAYFGPAQGDRKISEFIGLADKVLSHMQGAARQTTGLLAELIGSATPIIELLNDITLIYEKESQARARTLKKQLHGMMSDVKTIAKQARMVSFNAQIIAARAGAAGREFSVVAGVLTNITSEMDELIHAALRDAIE